MCRMIEHFLQRSIKLVFSNLSMCSGFYLPFSIAYVHVALRTSSLLRVHRSIYYQKRVVSIIWRHIYVNIFERRTITFLSSSFI